MTKLLSEGSRYACEENKRLFWLMFLPLVPGRSYLPYARFSGLAIMPLPLLISSIAMKEQISNKGVLMAAYFHNHLLD